MSYSISIPEIMKTTASALMYVYAYSWTPGFCFNQTDYPGCISQTQTQDYWKTNFTVHGLWPQYVDNGYPSYCNSDDNNQNFNETEIVADIGWDTLTQKWPNVQCDETDPEYDSFWEHEWTKHGTCSGLNQDIYFETAINLTNVLLTPTEIQSHLGESINADELRDAFFGSPWVALQCNKNGETGDYYLTGAYTCWKQNADDGSVGEQIVCPAEVVNEDTCYADDIFIPEL